MLTDALRYEEEKSAGPSFSIRTRPEERGSARFADAVYQHSSKSSPIRRQMIERQFLALQWSSTLRVGSVPTGGSIHRGRPAQPAPRLPAYAAKLERVLHYLSSSGSLMTAGSSFLFCSSSASSSSSSSSSGSRGGRVAHERPVNHPDELGVRGHVGLLADATVQGQQ